MQSSQVLRFAGDVLVEKVNVISSNGTYQDITNQVLTIQIFEDLFSPFITGNIVIKDSLDLVNLFPFVGEETLELKISTPTLKDGNIDAKFYIYKMTDRDLVGDKSVVYQLHFTSLDAVVDLNKAISKTFSGKVSDIAKTLLTDTANGLQTTKTLNIEETSNSTKYVSNFWSPIKNLFYIVSNAANKSGSPSYLYFENRDGYNFISLDTLFTKPVLQEFVYDNYVRDKLQGGGNIRNVNEDFKRIETITIPEAFDYISRIRNGMYGSKQYNYDIVSKKISSKNYDMLQSFDSRNHLNRYPLASKKAVYRYNSKIDFEPKYYNNFSNFGDVTNSSIIQERTSVLKQIESTKIQIIVPGRMDYTVGRKVTVTLPRIEPYTAEDRDPTDKMFSGTYIISAINHYINRERHECTLELVKDSYETNLDRNK